VHVSDDVVCRCVIIQSYVKPAPRIVLVRGHKSERFLVVAANKVRDLNRQLECHDDRVRELMAAQEIAKQEAERSSSLITTLRQHVADCEARHGGLEAAAGHAEQQLDSLQWEYADAQQHILQLSAQIRLQLRTNSVSLYRNIL